MHSVGIVGRSRHDQVDQAVQDGLTMSENLGLIVVACGVAERQHYVGGCDGGRCEGIGHSDFRLVDRGRLGAVQQVPDSRRAVVVLGIDRTSIQNCHGSGGIPEELVGGVTILGEPHLYSLDLASTEASGHELGGCVKGVSGNGDLKLLLVKGDGHEEFVGVEVHVVGNGHTTIHHTELFDLELGSGERGGRSDDVGDTVVDPEGRSGVQGTSDLNLLGEGICWKWNTKTVCSW